MSGSSRARLFFFKQKTAYEMRISDWSSDVCSSDLPVDVGRECGDFFITELGGDFRHDLVRAIRECRLAVVTIHLEAAGNINRMLAANARERGRRDAGARPAAAGGAGRERKRTRLNSSP